MRRIAVLALIALLCVPATVTSADEEPRREGLHTRIFEVGALTKGIPGFLRPVAPMDMDSVSDEENPLFGAEWEEPWYILGQVDELIEVLKSAVDPAVWEQMEGVDMAPIGEDRLVVRAPRATMDKAASFLADLERTALTPIAIDLAVVPVPAGTKADDVKVATSIAGVAVSAMPRQRACAWDGAQRSYVHDYDTEVAQSAQTSRPVLRVANLGLTATLSARPSPSGGPLRLVTDAVYTELAAADERDVGEDRRVEVQHLDTIKCHVDMMVTPGEWTVLTTGPLGAKGNVAFLGRATPKQLPLRATNPKHAQMHSGSLDDSGKMALRMFDVSRLSADARDVRGRAPWTLMPSSYTPPEPPELREPQPLMSPEVLPDLIITTINAPGAWDMGTIESRNGFLIVRNTPPILDAVETLIGKLRTACLRTLTIKAELIEVDRVTAARLSSAGCFDAATQMSEIVIGQASPVFQGQLTCPRDARRTLTAGTSFSYVQGFAVEVAEKAAIGNPIIEKGFEGVELDIQPSLSSTETAVMMDVRMVRTKRVDGNRVVQTPLGSIQTPELATLRLQSTTGCTLGQTVAMGVGGSGETRLVLLLTPTLKRASD